MLRALTVFNMYPGEVSIGQMKWRIPATTIRGPAVIEG